MQPENFNNKPSRLNKDKLNRNRLIFAISMIALQITVSLLYGYLVQIQHGRLNISSILIAIFTFFLVVIGTHQITQDLDYF